MELNSIDCKHQTNVPSVTETETDWPVGVTVTESESAPPFTASATDMAGGIAAYAGAPASGSYTTVVYTPGGGKLATYTNGSLVAAEIPLPGGGTAMYNAAGLNTLRHADWLGSSRLATTWNHNVYSKTAYAPFGETYNTAGSPDASFTGEDADTTSGAYNFLFRKLDPVAGRWLSPDPSGLAYADLSNPQSLNLYAYVMNDPLADFDPNGLDTQCAETLPSGAIGDALMPCYVMDASYNGLPPAVVASFEQAWNASQHNDYSSAVNSYVTNVYNNAWSEDSAPSFSEYWNGSSDIAQVNVIANESFVGDFLQNAGTVALPAAPLLPEVIGACIAAEPCPAIVLGGTALIFLGKAISMAKSSYDAAKCSKEVTQARNYCSELMSSPSRNGPARNVWGGDFNKCVMGQVSQRCGGNRVE